MFARYGDHLFISSEGQEVAERKPRLRVAHADQKIKLLAEVATGIIKELNGANTFKIEQTKPYSKGYNDCINEAKADQQRGARPELTNYPESIDGYDVIYLGFPNYWGTMPMAVFTFLEHFDFSGKTIKPFCTHEGSGMGSSVSDIKRLCPTAKVENGLAIHGGSAEELKQAAKTGNWLDGKRFSSGVSEDEITKWIKEIN